MSSDAQHLQRNAVLDGMHPCLLYNVELGMRKAHFNAVAVHPGSTLQQQMEPVHNVPCFKMHPLQRLHERLAYL